MSSKTAFHQKQLREKKLRRDKIRRKKARMLASDYKEGRKKSPEQYAQEQEILQEVKQEESEESPEEDSCTGDYFYDFPMVEEDDYNDFFSIIDDALITDEEWERERLGLDVDDLSPDLDSCPCCGWLSPNQDCNFCRSSY